MFVDIPTVRILLYVLVVIKVSQSAQDCDRGWFGEACQFKCHCSNSAECATSGECPNQQRCEPGFFGPGCQYVDVALQARPETDGYLTDQNESTCNLNTGVSSVRVSFLHGIAFTWFRLHVNNPSTLLSFVVKINHQHGCPNERLFVVSNTAVDVSCEYNPLLYVLQLIGAVAPDVCSIYISEGRNIALRQNVTQSSTYQNSNLSFASNAVDGDTNGDYEAGHCSHTDSDPVMAEWSLKYSLAHVIFGILIYNRVENRYRIRHFVVQTYNESGHVVHSYREERSPSLPLFDVNLTPRTAIMALSIQRIEGDEYGQRILSMCEVEIYGEAVCPVKYHGLSCNKQCACNNSQMCFPVTGVCETRCSAGAPDANCSFRCGPKCEPGQCNQSSGVCRRCEPGYKGSYCMEACMPGSYGQNCNMNCSRHCSSPCNHTNGHCVCNPPYKGDTCTECPQPFYGASCNIICPMACAFEICHPVTGTCGSCRGNRTGNFCEGCPETYYGPTCTSKCSEYCENRTCDVNTGACAVCTDGYSGPTCTNAPTPIRWIHMVAAAAGASVVSIVFMCWYLRKARNNGDVENEDGSNVAVTSLAD